MVRKTSSLTSTTSIPRIVTKLINCKICCANKQFRIILYYCILCPQVILFGGFKCNSFNFMSGWSCTRNKQQECYDCEFLHCVLLIQSCQFFFSFCFEHLICDEFESVKERVLFSSSNKPKLFPKQFSLKWLKCFRDYAIRKHLFFGFFQESFGLISKQYNSHVFSSIIEEYINQITVIRHHCSVFITRPGPFHFFESCSALRTNLEELRIKNLHNRSYNFDNLIAFLQFFERFARCFRGNIRDWFCWFQIYFA